MFTGLTMSIRVPDEGVIGESWIIVYRQDSSQMTESVRVFEGTTILPTLSESGDHYQWAITCLRDIADRAIAQLLREMNQEKEKPMQKHPVNQLS